MEEETGSDLSTKLLRRCWIFSLTSLVDEIFLKESSSLRDWNIRRCKCLIKREKLISWISHLYFQGCTFQTELHLIPVTSCTSCPTWGGPVGVTGESSMPLTRSFRRSALDCPNSFTRSFRGQSWRSWMLTNPRAWSLFAVWWPTPIKTWQGNTFIATLKKLNAQSIICLYWHSFLHVADVTVTVVIILQVEFYIIIDLFSLLYLANLSCCRSCYVCQSLCVPFSLKVSLWLFCDNL